MLLVATAAVSACVTARIHGILDEARRISRKRPFSLRSWWAVAVVAVSNWSGKETAESERMVRLLPLGLAVGSILGVSQQNVTLRVTCHPISVRRQCRAEGGLGQGKVRERKGGAKGGLLAL
ncbi:hypothetical protein F5887DRAFT_988282 [Amanita rubescens]|nr:hypothetical protein F5887DRAFT_996551 [Amanita rubescens]KAF8336011.1 hypothetical protein F5887DRAFT_988282 [Amanita rubescens]